MRSIIKGGAGESGIDAGKVRFVGCSFAIISALIWSLFPVITSGMVAPLPPIHYAAISTLIAAALFAVLITVRGRWSGLKLRETWRDIIILAFLNGAVYHGGVFIGSSLTTPANTSLILQMEILFSMLTLRVLGHERLSAGEGLGAGCMFLGATFIVWPQDGRFSSIQFGDLLLIGCAAVPPVANLRARRARQMMSGVHVIFLRSLLAGIMLLLVGALLEPKVRSAELQNSLGLLFLSGVVVMGLGKLIWIESIIRIPISVAVAFGAIAPAVTMLIAYLTIGTVPTNHQWAALALVSCGVLLLTRPTSHIRIQGEGQGRSVKEQGAKGDR